MSLGQSPKILKGVFTAICHDKADRVSVTFNDVTVSYRIDATFNALRGSYGSVSRAYRDDAKDDAKAYFLPKKVAIKKIMSAPIDSSRVKEETNYLAFSLKWAANNLNQANRKETIIVGPFVEDPLLASLKLKKFSELFDASYKIADALEAFHHAQLIHGDIHRRNIFLGKEVATFVDCGFTCRIGERSKVESNSVVGYHHPELTHENVSANVHHDIWSLGVTYRKMFLYSTIHGEQQFFSRRFLKLIGDMMVLQSRDQISLVQVKEQLRSLKALALYAEEEKRMPTVQELSEHLTNIADLLEFDLLVKKIDPTAVDEKVLSKLFQGAPPAEELVKLLKSKNRKEAVPNVETLAKIMKFCWPHMLSDAMDNLILYDIESLIKKPEDLAVIKKILDEEILSFVLLAGVPGEGKYFFQMLELLVIEFMNKPFLNKNKVKHFGVVWESNERVFKVRTRFCPIDVVLQAKEKEFKCEISSVNERTLVAELGHLFQATLEMKKHYAFKLFPLVESSFLKAAKDMQNLSRVETLSSVLKFLKEYAAIQCFLENQFVLPKNIENYSTWRELFLKVGEQILFVHILTLDLDLFPKNRPRFFNHIGGSRFIRKAAEKYCVDTYGLVRIEELEDILKYLESNQPLSLFIHNKLELEKFLKHYDRSTRLAFLEHLSIAYIQKNIIHTREDLERTLRWLPESEGPRFARHFHFNDSDAKQVVVRVAGKVAVDIKARSAVAGGAAKKVTTVLPAKSTLKQTDHISRAARPLSAANSQLLFARTSLARTVPNQRQGKENQRPSSAKPPNPKAKK